MTEKKKLFVAAAFIMLVLTPAAATDMTADPTRRHHHYRHANWTALPYPISYLHNYGPGPTPGTFAYYDGPSTNHCYQSAAGYIGQDRRRHPCR